MNKNNWMKKWLRKFFCENKGKPYKIFVGIALVLTILASVVELIGFLSDSQSEAGVPNSGVGNNTTVANNQIIVNNYNDKSANQFNNEVVGKPVMSENAYIDYLQKFIGDKRVSYSHYNDYDNDGKYELFALVGDKSDIEPETMHGEIWYVNQNDAFKVEDSIIYWTNPRTFLIEDQVFISFEQYFATGSVSCIWGVRDSQPYKPNISGKGNGIYINNHKEVEIIHSAYDMMRSVPDDRKTLSLDEMWLGHTWKPYYFYFDGNNFREYGAIEITNEALMCYTNGESILNNIVLEGFQIDKVLLRDNNVVHVCYSTQTHANNATETVYFYKSYRILENKLEPEISEFNKNNGLNNEDNGIYERAFIPSIATYPDNPATKLVD